MTVEERLGIHVWRAEDTEGCCGEMMSEDDYAILMREFKRLVGIIRQEHIGKK